MQKKKFNCDSCDAFGNIVLKNDSSEFYEISVCPACGAELNDRDDTEEDEF